MLKSISYVAVLAIYFSVSTAQDKEQNVHVPQDIILIIADDMGWNDVSFHGSDQILTPNIDALAYEGIILNKYYTHPICTPTRAALLTGHYASNTGMQGYPLTNMEQRALPRRFNLLPSLLRDRGYRTHLVGKWHLGHARKGDLPTAKGFDSHFGYHGGFIDYFEYELAEKFGNKMMYGYDFFRNMTPARDVEGYSTDVFTNEAVKIIDRAGDDPLFLMLSYTTPHSGNDEVLLQAPAQAVRAQRRVKSSARRIYAAMVRSLDDGIGDVISALKRNGRLQRSTIVFVSDNGSPVSGEHANWGSNWPLRGMKSTAWEGGVRAPAIIWSSSLPAHMRYESIFHVSDWFPTFLSIAGGDPLSHNIDGVSQWRALQGLDQPPRISTLIDADDMQNAAAYREGDLKIIMGTYSGGNTDEYYGDSGLEDPLTPQQYAEAITESSVALVLTENQSRSSDFYTPDHLKLVRDDLRINCDLSNAQKTFNNCTSGCLFDLWSDPCETHDLASERPDELKILRANLEWLLTDMVPSLPRIKDPRADPALHDGIWASWLKDDDVCNEIKST